MATSGLQPSVQKPDNEAEDTYPAAAQPEAGQERAGRADATYRRAKARVDAVRRFLGISRPTSWSTSVSS